MPDSTQNSNGRTSNSCQALPCGHSCFDSLPKFPMIGLANVCLCFASLFILIAILLLRSGTPAQITIKFGEESAPLVVKTVGLSDEKNDIVNKMIVECLTKPESNPSSTFSPQP